MKAIAWLMGVLVVICIGIAACIVLETRERLEQQAPACHDVALKLNSLTNRLECDAGATLKVEYDVATCTCRRTP
jgi:hypothetical protein